MSLPHHENCLRVDHPDEIAPFKQWLLIPVREHFVTGLDFLHVRTDLKDGPSPAVILILLWQHDPALRNGFRWNRSHDHARSEQSEF